MQVIYSGSASRRNYEDGTQDGLVETKVVYQLTFAVKQTILKIAILKQNYESPMIWGSGIWSQESGGFLGMALSYYSRRIKISELQRYFSLSTLSSIQRVSSLGSMSVIPANPAPALGLLMSTSLGHEMMRWQL